MRRVRVLIADDHTMFRYGLRALLDADPNVEVVGEAVNGRRAVEFTEQLNPDVILMDIGMPEMSGLEATRLIHARQPDVRVLILTMFEDDSVFQALRHGARGYLLKGAGGPETLRAVHAVASGEAIFSSSIASRVLRFFQHVRPEVPSAFPELTERERDVLELLAQGLTNAAIASRLGLSGKTVRNRVSEVFDKLQVAGRAEAIEKAREAGYGQE